MSYSPMFPSQPHLDGSPLLNMSEPNDLSPSSQPVEPAIAPSSRFLDLDDLMANGTLSWYMAQFLLQALHDQRRLIITGAANTGKTTLLRALAQAGISTHERVLVIEDVEELRLTGPDVITRIGFDDADEPNGFRQALRLWPDRLIIGELLGPRLLDYLEAGLTESFGMLATQHLRQPEDFVAYLGWMIQGYRGRPITEDELVAKASQGVDLIVPMSRDKQGHRRVVRAIQPLPDGTYRTAFADEGTLRMRA